MTKHAGAASAEAIKKTIDEAVAKGVAEAIAKVKADGDAALKVVTDQLAASTAAVTKMQDDTEIEQFRKEALDLGKPAEFGETLRALKKTSPTAYEALVKDAKSTAAVLASLEAAADVIRKADTKLSKAAAFTKAVEQNPELYQQHKIERDQARRQAA